MKRMLGRILLVPAIILALAVFVSAATLTPVTVQYEGQPMDDSLKGAIVNKTVMIPWDVLTRDSSAGVKGSYNAVTGKLKLTRKNINLEMKKGNKKITRNREMTFKSRIAPRYVTVDGVSRMMIPAKKVTELLGLKYTYDSAERTVRLIPKKAGTVSTKNLKASVFLLTDTEEFVEIIGPLARADYKKTGVLASVTIAQAIDESWSGTSLLAQKGNNLFGMKASLSGNRWKGSVWKRGSIIKKKTKESRRGRTVTITAKFRKYPNVNKSIADHSAYLKNAKKGKKKRYQGLTSTKSYHKQISILMKGGYCTFKNYGSDLERIIIMYNLTRFDQ